MIAVEQRGLMGGPGSTGHRRRVRTTPFRATGPAAVGAVTVVVAALTGLALFLGFAHLQRRSLWQDEAFTWSTVDRGFPALVSVLVRHEGYQILHSLIEWPTNRISSTVDALRTPSVLAFAAAVPAVWLAGRRLFDERTGLLAALLFTLNGFALQYAQEARGYMLAAAFCAYAGALLVGYVLAPRRWTRVGWIACSALAIYAHGFAALGSAGRSPRCGSCPPRGDASCTGSATGW